GPSTTATSSIVLPTGGTLGANTAPGVTYLAGRALAVGTYNFTLSVTDSASVTATQAFTWVVSPLANSYFNLPLSGTPLASNTPYSQPLLALGGTPAYTWTAIGSMPPGLVLSSAGIVSGTPTNAGFFSTLIRATDRVGNAIQATIGFSIAGGHIAGTVTASGDGPLSGVAVQIYNSAGAFVTSSTTDASGNYTSTDLSTGTYYARTSNSLRFLDQLDQNIVCNGCNVTTGAPIPVTSPSTTS